MRRFALFSIIAASAAVVSVIAGPARADMPVGLGLGGGVSPGAADPPGNTLWYNGDADGVNSYFNQNNSVVDQVVYNEFNVTAAAGWTIQNVWSNDIFGNGPPSSTTAAWEIRSGMNGSGGMLVASGDALATLTPTGLTVLGYTEYMVQVSGLSAFLSQGTYWLAVYPDNTNGGDAGNDTTSGANGIGTPTGSNGGWWFTNDQMNYTNFPTGTSAGVGGIVGPNISTPEPSTFLVAACGSVAGLGYWWRKRRVRPAA